MKEHIPEILEFLEAAEESRPLVQKTLKALKSYGPEIKDLLDGILDYSIDRRINAVLRLEQAGFSREDAISLVMDEWYSIARALGQQRKIK